MNDETKHLFFKSPNPFPHSPSRRRLRVADILLSDEDHGRADSMDYAGETPPPSRSRRRGYSSAKCYAPWRLVARLLAEMRLTKGCTALRQRQMVKSEVRDSDTTSLPLNGSNGNDESGQLNRDDTSFKVGVGCGLLYLIAASKNELGKMVELRKEMEMLLQNVKGALQSKDALHMPLEQGDDALACSITEVQEVSSSRSHPSIHSKGPSVQPESKSSKRFIEYNINDRDEFAQEINELQAEFEVELERLQLYLDGEDVFEDAQKGKFKSHSRMAENRNWLVTVKDSYSDSHSSSFGEIIMNKQGASADVSFGVPPVELERRLHELLQSRLQEQITELESAFECTRQKLIEKEMEVTWWKDTALLISQHVPETSRFTFRLDPDAALKLSQLV